MERMVRNALNKKIKIILWAVCLLLTVPAVGGYELSWRTIDGGGVSSGEQ